MTLLEEIAMLVFENATEGIFLLNTCLPMGLCVSGEGMDVVISYLNYCFLEKSTPKKLMVLKSNMRRKPNRKTRKFRSLAIRDTEMILSQYSCTTQKKHPGQV